jgi:DNA-binding MarR family transcriptional regulator
LSAVRKRASRSARPEAERIANGYLPHALSRLMNALNLKLMESLRSLDLTTQQFRVMQVLFVHEVATISEISRDAVIEQSVVSRIVDQLEEKNFVKRRRRQGNARVVDVALTPVGVAVFNSVMPHADAIVEDAVSVLSGPQKQTLLALLSTVLQHVRGAQP